MWFDKDTLDFLKKELIEVGFVLQKESKRELVYRYFDRTFSGEYILNISKDEAYIRNLNEYPKKEFLISKSKRHTLRLFYEEAKLGKVIDDDLKRIMESASLKHSNQSRRSKKSLLYLRNNGFGLLSPNEIYPGKFLYELKNLNIRDSLNKENPTLIFNHLLWTSLVLKEFKIDCKKSSILFLGAVPPQEGYHESRVIGRRTKKDDGDVNFKNWNGISILLKCNDCGESFIISGDNITNYLETGNYYCPICGDVTKPNHTIGEAEVNKLIRFELFSSLSNKYKLEINYFKQQVKFDDLKDHTFDFYLEIKNKKGKIRRLIIELDGKYHNSRKQAERDLIKTVYCRKNDIILVRVRNTEVLKARSKILKDFKDKSLGKLIESVDSRSICTILEDFEKPYRGSSCRNSGRPVYKSENPHLIFLETIANIILDHETT